MTIKKRIIGLLMILVLIISPLQKGNINAEDKITVYFTCEKCSLGQGLIVSPCKVVVDKGTLASEVLKKIFDNDGIKFDYTGTIKNDFYLSCIKNVDDKTVNIPNCIKDEYGSNYETNKYAPDLQEKSYTQTSGWMYYVNHLEAQVGMSEYELGDGDVIRIQFTLYDLGGDLKKVKNRDNLIKALADNEDTSYKSEALKILADYDSKTSTIRNIVNKIKEEAKTETESSYTDSDKSQNSTSDNSETTKSSENNGSVTSDSSNNSSGNNSNSNSGNNSNSSNNNSSSSSKKNRSTDNNSDNDSKNSNTNNGSKETDNSLDNESQTESNGNIILDNTDNDITTNDGDNTNSKENYKNNNKNENKTGEKENEFAGVNINISDEQKERIDDKLKELCDYYKNHIFEKDYKTLLEEESFNDGYALAGQWPVIAMADCGFYDDEFLNIYLKCLENEIKNVDGNLSNNKYTEYSKVIITLESLGINVKEEYPDFLEKLDEKDVVNSQGINGSIWALIALTCSEEIYEEKSELAKYYCDYIIDNTLESGGYSLVGDEADVDLSAMAVIALSNYKYRTDDKDSDNEEIKDNSEHIENTEKTDKSDNTENTDNSGNTDSVVIKSISKAIKCIKKMQNKDGSYESMGNVNSESLSYATIAMAIAGKKDYDYNTAIDNLFKYECIDGLFAHTLELKETDMSDGIATSQAMLLLCEMKHICEGSGRLFITDGRTLVEKDISANESKEDIVKKKESDKTWEKESNNTFYVCVSLLVLAAFVAVVAVIIIKRKSKLKSQ